MIMPSFYCGPVDYYVKMLQLNTVYFELHEHFVKQTPRNRCTIDSPNGAVTLTVPIKKTASKMKMKDVRISFEEDWPREHWHALKSAYGASPYFEFYDYLFEPLFSNPETYLVDFNTALHKVVLRCLDQEQKIEFTRDFKPVSGTEDHRVRYNVKQHRFTGSQPEYRQVFAGKHGFRKNMSILDLLFNLGPEARTYLFSLSREQRDS